MVKILDTFSRFVVKSRLLVLIIFGGLFLLLGYQTRSLKADFTPQDLFTTFEDQQATLEEFKSVFGFTENVAAIVIQAPDVRDVEVLQHIHDLSIHFGAQTYTERVESLTVTSFPRSDGEQIDPDPVIQGDTVTDEEAAILAEAIESSGIVRGRLISENNRVTTVALFLPGTVVRVDALSEALDDIETYLEAHPPPDGVTCTLGGLPHIRVYITDRFKEDQLRLIPLCLLISMFVLFLSLRWFAGVIYPAVGVIISATLTLGIMALVGEPLNIINQVVPTLLVIIGISDSIHFLTRFREEMRAKPDDPKRASRRALKTMALACLLTSLTTAVGFASLVVSRTDILRRFGITVAIGVVIAYFVTIHVLPSLLTFTRAKTGAKFARQENDRLERFLKRLVGAIIKRPKTVLAAAAFVLLLSILVASRVEINSRLLDAFDRDDPAFQTMTLLESELDGILPLEVSFESERYGRFSDAQVLNALHELRNWVAEQEGVLSATSYADFLHETWVIYNSDPALRDEPFESTDEVGALDSLLTRDVTDPFVTLDRRRARLNVQLADIGAVETVALGDAITTQVEALMGDFEDIEFALTGDAYVGSIGLNSLVADLIGSLLLAFVFIFLLMMLLFRNLRMGLISVPPNIIPLVITMAFMTVAGIQLNTTTVVIFSISIGLAVDDTIHFLARFNEEVASGCRLEQAIKRATVGSGRAILVTSVMLVAGMAILTTSSFIPIRQFGVLLSVTLVGCLLGDLLVLPALLKVAWKTKTKTKKRGVKWPRKGSNE